MLKRFVRSGITAVILSLAVLVVAAANGSYLWWGNREPIYIYGDWDFTCENGVVAGCGTRWDPYIIEGWRIVPQGAGFGIYIDHTTRYFVIRNCVIEGASDAAIHFNSMSNGRIEGCQLLRSERGLLLENSHYNAIAGNLIAENRYGVVAAVSSRDNTVTENSFIWNGLDGYDPERRTLWYCGRAGNYWSDYEGCDYDGDGIGDQPYSPLGDRFPLMVSPMASALPLTYQPASHCVTSTNVIRHCEWRDVNCDGIPDPCIPKPAYEFPAPCTPPVGGFQSSGPVTVQPVPPYSPRPEAVAPTPPSLPEGTIIVNARTPITLCAVDAASGLACMMFSIDGGEWRPYQGPFTLTGPSGPRTIAYYAMDNLGNQSETRMCTVFLDNTPPDTTLEVGEPRVIKQQGVLIPVPAPPCEEEKPVTITPEEAAESPGDLGDAGVEAPTPAVTPLPEATEEPLVQPQPEEKPPEEEPVEPAVEPSAPQTAPTPDTE